MEKTPHLVHVSCFGALAVIVRLRVQSLPTYGMRPSLYYLGKLCYFIRYCSSDSASIERRSSWRMGSCWFLRFGYQDRAHVRVPKIRLTSQRALPVVLAGNRNIPNHMPLVRSQWPILTLKLRGCADLDDRMTSVLPQF